jgi:hypothetical protein
MDILNKIVKVYSYVQSGLHSSQLLKQQNLDT